MKSRQRGIDEMQEQFKVTEIVEIECKVSVADNLNYKIHPKGNSRKVLAYRENIEDAYSIKPITKKIRGIESRYIVSRGSTEQELLAKQAMALDKALEAPTAYIEDKGYSVEKVGLEYIVSKGNNYSLASKNLDRLAHKIVEKEAKEGAISNG